MPDPNDSFDHSQDNVSRVLVTGASGFIGRWIVERFESRSIETWGIGQRRLDLKNYRSLSLGSKAEKLESLLSSQAIPAPDVIVHAAARSSPWGTREQFEKDNVRATQQIVEYISSRPHTRLVFISSSSVLYRAGHQLDLHETTPFPARAVNRYAETKQRCERAVESLGDKAVILRPRAVFGPGDTVLLPRILEAARAGRLPLVRSSTPIIGDLVYIENLVDVIEQATLRRDVQGVFNVTNHEPVEIREFLCSVFDQLKIPRPKRRVRVGTAMAAATVLEAFHAIFRPSIEPKITRFGVHVFAYSKTFDPERSRATFGSPRISLQEGLRRTVEYFSRIQ